jgi:transcriptional regulator with GAF, ATPase, and Fis domain
VIDGVGSSWNGETSPPPPSAVEKPSHSDSSQRTCKANLRFDPAAELEHVIQRAVALAVDDMIAQFTFAPAADWSTDPAEAIWALSRITIRVGTTVDEANRQFVEATVEKCRGNKLKAAHIHGISPQPMYRHFSDLKP